MDQRAYGEGTDRGANSVGLHDIARVFHTQTIDDLQKRAEIAIPAPVTNEEGGRKDASTEYGPVEKERAWDEGDGGEELFPDSKRNDEDDSNY